MPAKPGGAKGGAGTVWVDVRGDTSQLGRDISESARTAGSSIASGLGSGARTVLGDLGKTAGLTAVAVGGIAAAAVKVSSEFSESMSGVGAVANASAADLDLLRESALEAGAATSFSASEAAQAQGELVKAGVSVSDVLGGALTGSLGLAAAGQLDLAKAAEISAQAMNIFKLGGEDVSHIADVLAAGANKSATDVGQLGDALRQGGLVAAQTGLSMEETVGVLSMFADQALIGSDAGTSLKTMLQRLVPQSANAADMMEQLGLKFFDAQGAFVGIDKVAQQLQDSLGGLSDEQRQAALTTLFGSDAIRGASILMDGGAKSVHEYTDAVNDQGAATRMAAAQLDNLKGDIEEFSGSTETALIRLGDLGDSSLRGFVQSATGFVNVFNDFATTPAWDAIGDNVERITKSTDGLVGGLSDRLKLFLSGISSSDVDKFFAKIEGGAKTAKDAIDGMEGVVAGLGISLSTMALRSVPLIGGLVPAIAPITGVLGGLVLGSKEGRKALSDLGKQAGELSRNQGPELGRSLSGLSGILSKSLAKALESVGGAVIDTAGKLGPILGDAIDELGPPLGDLIDAGSELAGDVLPMLADIAGVVLPPSIRLFGTALDVAAKAAEVLADNSWVLAGALAGLSVRKYGDDFVNFGTKLAGVAGTVKTAGSDFGTYFQVLRSEGGSVASSLSGAAKASGGLSGAMSGLNIATIAATAAIGVGVFAYQSWSKNVERVRKETEDLSKALVDQGSEVLPALAKAFQEILSTRKGFDDSFNKTGISIANVTKLVNEHTGDIDKARSAYHAMGEDIATLAKSEKFSDIFLDMTPESVRPTVEALLEMVRAGSLTETEFEKALDAMTDLDQQAMGTAKNVGIWAEQFKTAAKDVDLTAEAQKNLAAAMDDNLSLSERRDALAALAAAYPELAAATGLAVGQVTDANRKLADETEKAVNALKSLRDEFSQFANLDRDLDQASRDLAASAQRTADSFKQGAGVSSSSEIGRANADALKAQIDTAEKVAAIQAELDTSGKSATATLQAQADALARLRDEGSLTAVEYEQLIELYDLTPEAIQTTVTADIADAEASIADLRSQIEDVPGITDAARAEILAALDEGSRAEAERLLNELSRSRTVRIKMAADAFMAGQSVTFADLLGIQGKRAAGGPVGPGKWLVGEEGPEILDVAGSGYVHNAEQARQIMSDKSVGGDEFMLAELRSLRGDFASLADAMSILATRPQAAPVVDVHASAGVEVSAETRFRKAAR